MKHGASLEAQSMVIGGNIQSGEKARLRNMPLTKSFPCFSYCARRMKSGIMKLVGFDWIMGILDVSR